MIIDKIGDILHTEADVICHQVNCKGVMSRISETNPKSVIIRRTIQNLPGNLSGIWPCKSW